MRRIGTGKKIKNKKGMTLVELIVGLAIAAIFATVAIAVVSPIGRIYDRSQDQSEAQMIADTVVEEIRGKVDTSSQLEAVTVDGVDGVRYDRGTITLDEQGYLQEIYQDGTKTLLYASDYYNKKYLTLKAENQEDQANQVKLTISVWRAADGEAQEKQLFSTEVFLQPIRTP